MHYIYFCTSCNKHFSSTFIEENDLYLCPECGALPKNAPLKGVLEVRYDFDFILNKLSKKHLFNFISSNFESIPYLFPLEYQNNLLKNISEQKKENIQLSFSFVATEYKKNKIYFLDDSRNPTFSFKDRASVLVAAKAIQVGKNSIICASTGNAGSSIAGICARLGLKSIIFVPEKIPLPKKLQIEMYGADLIKVNGDYDYAFDLSLLFTKKLKMYNRNTAYNPLTIEGKKTAAYDIFNKFKDSGLPNKIIIPAGDGVILGGLYKGFKDLLALGLIDKLPQLIAAQPQNGSAIIDYIETGNFIYKNSETIADSLSAGAPRNLYMAAKAVKESAGIGIRIDDDITLKFQRELSSKYGLLVEPAAAITLAAYDTLLESNYFGERDKVLLLLTGNGLKDTKSFEKYANKDKVFTEMEIYNHFGIKYEE
jgi:threonine synthase